MEGGWEWSLPPKVAKSAEDAQVSGVAIFAETGHRAAMFTRKRKRSGRRWNAHEVVGVGTVLGTVTKRRL